MTRLSHVILFTPQLAAMRQFYRESLGLPLREDGPEWVTFETGDATLALHAMPDRGRQGIQIRFEVPDLEARARELKARGAEMEGDIQTFSQGTVACFWDPEGCLLSLFRPAGPEARRAAGDKQLSRVIVNTRDLPSTRVFYRQVFGLQPTVESTSRVEFATGGGTLVLQAGGAIAAGQITIAFSAADLDDWVEEIDRRGVAISTVVEDDSGPWLEAADPDGNLLAFGPEAMPEPLEEELAEVFEDDRVPARAPIRKPLRKGSKAVSRVVLSLGQATAGGGKAEASKPAKKGAAIKRVASARGSGPAGSRVKPKRTADPKRARTKPAIGRLKKAERRTLTSHKRAVARASKGKPVKRAAARLGKRK